MLRATSSPHVLTVQIQMSFAPEDAARIHELVEQLEPGVKLQIDFRRARECADVALALLARDIVQHEPQVELYGTSQHQRRLLAYFGVSSPAAASGA